MSSPRYFVRPFADDGDRIAVPDDQLPAQTVNYETGWTPLYSIPQGDPGSLNTSRQGENQLFYDITLLGKQLQENGVLPWSTDVVYAENATVTGSNGVLYRAVVSNTGVDPTTVVDFLIWTYAAGYQSIFGTYDIVPPVSNNTKILIPASGTPSVQGVWENGAMLYFRNTTGGVNPGNVDIVIDDNASMNLVPIVTTPGDILVGGEIVDDQIYGLVYHQSTNEFVLVGGIATVNSYGITQLTDSILSSSTTTAATANAVRLAAQINNTTVVPGSSGYYRDNDSGFLIQWGVSGNLNYTTAVQTVTLVYPIPFNSIFTIASSAFVPDVFVGVTSVSSQANAQTHFRYQLNGALLLPTPGTLKYVAYGLG